MNTLLRSMILALLISSSSLSHATRWALAERNEDDIRARIEKLQSVLGDAVSDHDARILSDELYMNVHADGHVIMQNRVIEILGDPHPGLTTRALDLPPGYTIATVAGFVVRRDGDVLRLDESDFAQTEETPSGPRLILEYPDLRPGDVFGYSVSRKATGVMPAARLPLVEDLPVAYGMMRIKTDGTVYYAFALDNVDDELGRIEEMERENARPIDIKVRYGPLDVVEEPILARPRPFRQPQCIIRLQGYHRRGADWSEVGSWEEVAQYYAFDIYAWLRYSERLLADTSIAPFDTTATDFEKSDAVFRWVRDELRRADANAVQGGFRNPDEIIASGFATDYEKTVLMAAILRTLGVTPRLALVRNPAAAPMDREVPGTDQFTDELIVVGENDGFRMYIPSDPASEPGFVPPALRGGELFVPNLWKAEEERKNRRRVTLSFLGTGESMELEMTDPDAVFEQDSWFAWGQVPGDPSELVGRVREDVVHRGDGRGSDRKITSTGYTSLLAAARTETIDEWLSWWDPAHAQSVSKQVGTRVNVDDADGTVVVESTVDLPSLPPTAGADWTLPAEVLFGRPFFEGWTGPDRDDVYIPATTTFHRQTRLPLPEGWTDVNAVDVPHVDHERFSYDVSVHVEDAAVVLDRVVTLFAGTTPRDELVELDRAIAEVMEVEGKALVIRGMRLGGGR